MQKVIDNKYEYSECEIKNIYICKKTNYMQITRITLHNWKNFQNCDVELSNRSFIIGANAAGKSNFIDAIRFLRDIAKQAGGLQSAVEERGGITKIRCLAARTSPDVRIKIELGDANIKLWSYELGFVHTGGGIMKNQVRINCEKVFSYKSNTFIVDRSERDEDEDDETLKYTHLEQAVMNKDFRELQMFLQNIEYLNIVPQLVRESSTIIQTKTKEDYFGRNFLERLSKKNARVRDSYFKKIEQFLRIAVPQLRELTFKKDAMGIPHLEARYEHWRAKGSKQQETQFSDGTIRLIGFLFCLLDCNGLVLLEEPEINLNTAIITQLPAFIANIQRTKKQNLQVVITTHSYELLSDAGIGIDEVILLRGSREGTTVDKASDLKEISDVVNAGFSIAEAALSSTRPEDVESITQLKMEF